MPRLTRVRHAEMLADYIANDLTIGEIAAKYGVHSTAVSHAAQRAGLPMRQAGQPLNPKRATRRKWQKQNPEKRKAHKAVERALEKGELISKPCERCGEERSQAHHDDYSKPLEVIWLCQLHHKQRHRELNEAALTEGWEGSPS